MRWGGLSESCIRAGYNDSRYAFLAVTLDGRVRAQSLLYVNDDPNDPEKSVLVIDNIEANGKTDQKQMRQIYTEALKQFIDSGAIAKPVSAVHLGIGYSSVTFDDLPEASIVPTPLAGTYTDARASQRLLLDLRK